MLLYTIHSSEDGYPIKWSFLAVCCTPPHFTGYSISHCLPIHPPYFTGYSISRQLLAHSVELLLC